MPWTMMRQSLKIGNAASMINAITKLFLTKLSIASLTNWVGLTNNPDDGMNLMQQIISTIVGWDIAEYQKHINVLEKYPSASYVLSSEHLKEIRDYLDAPREFQLSLRNKSIIESKSIISIIVEEADLASLSETDHEIAMEYLAFYSSVRNRQQLEKIVCKSQPDLLTQTIREGIAAYEPLIRNVHRVVDLSAANWDLECFLTDFMALFPKQSSSLYGATDDGGHSAKSVGVDQVAAVLRKHQRSLHRFLHNAFKKSEEITDDYRAYVKNAAVQFRSLQPSSAAPADDYAGDTTPALQEVFARLSSENQKKVEDALDGYAAYLMALDSVSDDRLRGVLEESVEDAEDQPIEGQLPGPGTYLARWTSILGSTPITPLNPTGKVRYGTARARKPKAPANGGAKTPTTPAEPAPPEVESHFFWPEPPTDTDIVISLLGGPFKERLAEIGKAGWEDAPPVPAAEPEAR
jgi:hypothetical protein